MTKTHRLVPNWGSDSSVAQRHDRTSSGTLCSSLSMKGHKKHALDVLHPRFTRKIPWGKSLKQEVRLHKLALHSLRLRSMAWINQATKIMEKCLYYSIQSKWGTFLDLSEVKLVRTQSSKMESISLEKSCMFGSEKWQLGTRLSDPSLPLSNCIWCLPYYGHFFPLGSFTLRSSINPVSLNKARF